jgi:hypothetical protein
MKYDISDDREPIGHDSELDRNIVQRSASLTLSPAERDVVIEAIYAYMCARDRDTDTGERRVAQRILRRLA